MGRNTALVFLLAAFPLRSFAGEPPVLPPLEVPVLTNVDAIQVDGDLTDWRQVIGPPTLAMIDMWGDPTESPCCAYCPSTFWIGIWMAVLPPDRVLVAFDRGDDVISDGMVDVWRDGQFEFMIEVAPQEVASDAATAQRVEVLPFAEGGLSVRYTGTVGAWRNTTEFIHGVTDSDPPKNREIATRVEVSLTVFDVVSDVGLQESVRSALEVGDVITLGVIGVDVDPCDWCVAVVTYPATLARDLRKDASGFGTAILTRLEPPPTVVSPSGWGSVKRLWRW